MDKNEELLELIRNLDDKMNILEQFFINKVDNGEEVLMELINSHNVGAIFVL